MATSSGWDGMPAPVGSGPALGRTAVETLERSERMRPAVLAVMMLGAMSMLLPGAPQWIGFLLGGTALLLDRRFRATAYRFVGSPYAERGEVAEFWGLTSIAYVLFTLPLLALLLVYQLAGCVAGVAAY